MFPMPAYMERIRCRPDLQSRRPFLVRGGHRPMASLALLIRAITYSGGLPTSGHLSSLHGATGATELLWGLR